MQVWDTIVDAIYEYIYDACISELLLALGSVAKLSIATGHAMQIYNCLNCPRQL